MQRHIFKPDQESGNIRLSNCKLQEDIDEFKEKLQGGISAAKDIPPAWKIHPLVITLSTVYSQKPEISARVLGAINAFFQKMEDRILDPRPLEQFYDRAETHTCKVLGDMAFASAFAQSQKISLDEALDLVLKAVEEM